MTGEERLNFDLSVKLLRLMQNEKILFEKKKGTMDYLIKMGADVNAKIFGKTMAVWAKELGDEKAIQFVKENNGKEEVISKEEAESLGKEFWGENGELKSIDEIKDLVMCGANLGAFIKVYNSIDERYEDTQIWKNLKVEEINEILEVLPNGYVIDGNVNLSQKGLEELPDFSNVKVKGNFDCYGNNLTALRGAPSEVGGYFDCSWNKLTTLEGAPCKVERHFNCCSNLLTNLRGAPSVVRGDFRCNKNKLVNLEGAPRKVGRDFDCNNNKLTSLSGKPRNIGGDFIIEEEVKNKLSKRGLYRIFGGRE